MHWTTYLQAVLLGITGAVLPYFIVTHLMLPIHQIILCWIKDEDEETVDWEEEE